ncbi:MAG TPA: DUF4136 domain-containing protein [Candidatus Binatia bacterium]|nr:DUF4136 domain-containing protein [Candidatus Binatia bacterium]
MPRVAAHYDPAIDFSLYRTYEWGPVSVASTEQGRLLDRRIRAAIEDRLAAKGFLRQSAASPDFRVAYGISIRDQTIDTLDDFYAYREAGGSGNVVNTFTEGYEQGALRIEILDPHSGQPAWRAVVKVAIEEVQRDDRLGDIIAEMLQTFPPRPAP